MNEELFRKSSVEYATSREKLDAYIKVTNPSAWFTVIGIFLLLICAAVFCGASGLKTTIPAAGVVYKEQIHIFVSPEEAKELKEGMAFEKGQQKLGEILEITAEPVRREFAGGGYLTEYFRDVRLGKWNVEVIISNDQRLARGEEVEGSIVTEESKIFELIVSDGGNLKNIE